MDYSDANSLKIPLNQTESAIPSNHKQLLANPELLQQVKTLSNKSFFRQIEEQQRSYQYQEKRKAKEKDAYNLGYIINLGLTGALGGLCFGFDTGIIGGAVLFLENDFVDIEKSSKQLIISIAILGAAIGSIFSGFLSDEIGRKTTIIIADVFMTLGSIVMTLSPTINILVAGRFTNGFGVGMAAMISTVYLSEISPSQIRGAITTLNIMAITFGQFVALLICLYMKDDWRLMLFSAGIPSFLQLILMLWFMPESPRFLIKKGKSQEAYDVVKKMFKHHGEIYFQEIDSLKEEEEEQLYKSKQNIKQALMELTTTYRRNLTIGVVLQACQQLCGINTVMYYGPFILKDAGFDQGGKHDLIMNTLPLGFINFVGTIVTLMYSDKKGRRYLMLRFIPFVSLSMFALSYNQQTFGGYLAMFSVCCFLLMFSIGLGAQPWTICSEIFPTHLRGLANSITTTSNWLFNYLVSSIFLTVTHTQFGKVVSYQIIGFFGILTVIFIYYNVPETKELFMSKHSQHLKKNYKRFQSA